jgi:hypothetical protein
MTCEVTEWQIVGDYLARQLDFVGVEPETTVQLRVTVKADDTGMIEALPYIMLAPAVSLAPEAYLVMGLWTMDLSVRSGFLTVRTTRTPGGANKFWIEAGDDARKVTEVLWTGREMRWIVTDGNETLVKLDLHNDPSFRDALKRIRDKVQAEAH